MSNTISDRIADAVKAAGLAPLSGEAISRLSEYISLILRWNTWVNLTAIRDEDGIISRHIIESIRVIYNLPRDVSTLLDFGSGAGVPGIPIAICRPDIIVTLAESQNKKAAFLMEAVRVLDLNAKVHSGRAEELKSQFDCVTLRAVEKMATAVSSAAGLVAPDGWLALMTTAADADQLKAAAGAEFVWKEPASLVGSVSRVLVLGSRVPEGQL
jgi:16S rRNA (guanine527-N7)-methyltransferase